MAPGLSMRLRPRMKFQTITVANGDGGDEEVDAILDSLS